MSNFSGNVNKLDRHQILGADGKTMVYVYDGLSVNYRPTKGFINYSYYIDSNGKRWKTRAYNQWTAMTSRCNSRGVYQVNQPTYVGVTTSEEFADYDKWCAWAENKVGFMTVDENGRLWQLDKDLLATGNLHYSRDTVCFLPASVNSRLGSFGKAEHKLKEKMFKDIYDEYFDIFDDDVLEAFFDLSKFDFTLSKSGRITLEEYENKKVKEKIAQEINSSYYGMIQWNDIENPTSSLCFANGTYSVTTMYKGNKFKGRYVCVKEAIREKIKIKREIMDSVESEFGDCDYFSEKNFSNLLFEKRKMIDDLEYQLENGYLKVKQWVQVEV